MKASIRIAVLLCCLSLVSPGQQKPEWAKNLPNLQSRVGYFQGLGIAARSNDEATDWNKASEGARRDIALQIRVRIISAVTSNVREINKDGKSNFSEVFQSVTQQIAEGTLEGLEIHRWYDSKKSTYYAYAEVSRAEIEAKYDEFFHNSVRTASRYYSAGRKAMTDGNPFLGITRYFEALKVSVLAETYLNKSVAGDLDSSGVAKPLTPFLQNELCRVLSEIRFQTISGNSQQAEMGRMLEQPLAGRITYGESGTPVRNALLSATFVSPAEGEVSGEFRSDPQGDFRFAVNEVKQGEAVSRVRVGLDLRGIEGLVDRTPDAVRCWKLCYLDFDFRMKVRTNLNIAMHILERNLGKTITKSNVQEQLQKKLIGGRYTVVEESRIQSVLSLSKIDQAIEVGTFDPAVQALSSVCDVVIVGLVETKERSNPASGMFFSTGNATIRVVEAKTGRIIASTSLNNEKEGGNSYEVAGLKLLNRMGDRIGLEIKEQMDKALR